MGARNSQERFQSFEAEAAQWNIPRIAANGHPQLPERVRTFATASRLGLPPDARDMVAAYAYNPRTAAAAAAQMQQTLSMVTEVVDLGRRVRMRDDMDGTTTNLAVYTEHEGPLSLSVVLRWSTPRAPDGARWDALGRDFASLTTLEMLRVRVDEDVRLMPQGAGGDFMARAWLRAMRTPTPPTVAPLRELRLRGLRLRSHSIHRLMWLYADTLQRLEVLESNDPLLTTATPPHDREWFDYRMGLVDGEPIRRGHVLRELSHFVIQIDTDTVAPSDSVLKFVLIAKSRGEPQQPLESFCVILSTAPPCLLLVRLPSHPIPSHPIPSPPFLCHTRAKQTTAKNGRFSCVDEGSLFIAEECQQSIREFPLPYASVADNAATFDARVA